MIYSPSQSLGFVDVIELLINGISTDVALLQRRWPGIFLTLRCHFHKSRKNQFATTKTASYDEQATEMYYITL